MGDAEDFWPSLDDVEDANSPVVILRKQAELLSDKTGHRLRGRIVTSTVPARSGARGVLGLDLFAPVFNHAFLIEVPALDDYSYTLFSVAHGLESYPVAYEAGDGEWGDLNDPDRFRDWLKGTLSSEKTKRILRTLSQQAG